MPVSVRVPIEGEFQALASDAALWLRAFHADVSVVLDGAAAVLASNSRDAAGLAAVWISALANERLHARGRAARLAALGALAR